MRHRLAPLAVLVALSLTSVLALAKKPEDVFGGRVMLSEKSYPLESKSAAAYIAAVKKQSKDRFQENKEKQQWLIYYAAFFKKPLNDLEVKVTIYDVTDGSQRFIDSWEEFLTERNQRVIVGKLKLKRQDGKVNPNSKILMVMESRGAIVASASFYILGEGKKFTGKVEFSEDEAKNGEQEGEAAGDEAKKPDEGKKKGK